jgi:3-hydroxyacyl-CoA dehydrogenase
MKLFEVVKGAKSAPDTLATAMVLGRKIAKISAMAGNCDGFVANRSRGPFGTEMNLMVEEGALPEQIDKVMVDFGCPIGPFATTDLSGLDIGYDSRQRRAAQDPNFRKLPIADALVEMGRLGQKTGAGWFRYEKGDRTPHADPEVARLIKEKAAEIGIEQRSFSDEEILYRLLFASVNEACEILEEGKAYRASDIDVMWLGGFNFPRYRAASCTGPTRSAGQPRSIARSPPRTSATAPAGPRRRCCAASPKPAGPSATPNPAARCSAHGGAGGRVTPGRGVQEDYIPVAGLDPWAFSPRTRSVGTHAHGADRKLVSQSHVDLLQQAAAGFEAADVGGDLGGELTDGRPPRDMRHDRDFGMQPERPFRRQGLGPQCVQCSVGELAPIERGDQVRLHDMFAASDIHEHRAFRHHREGAGAEDAFGFPRQRQQAHGNVGLVQKWLELIETVKNRDLGFLPRVAHPSRNRKAE